MAILDLTGLQRDTATAAFATGLAYLLLLLVAAAVLFGLPAIAFGFPG